MSVNKLKWYLVEILLLSTHFVEIRVEEEVLDFFFLQRRTREDDEEYFVFIIRANKWTVEMKSILDSSWEKN